MFSGWLEPLLDRIAENRTNVAVPMISSINDTDFQINVCLNHTLIHKLVNTNIDYVISN